MENLWRVFVLVSATVQSGQGQYLFDTEFFEVPLDHFSFAIKGTLDIKYLVNDTFWDKDNNGPIFFYTGNEGSIESFAENTGFMWDIAEEFKAAVIFAEHRFYGSSVPSEELKFKLLSSGGIRVMGYLTVQQALADFASLINYYKKTNNATMSPVISFGGSYGGVLTAWLRMKYPHIVQGGISASAPFYLQSIPCGTHDMTLTSIFAQENDNCAPVIRKSWTYLNKFGQSAKGRKWLSNKWGLCDPLESVQDVTSLKDWLETMYSLMGMANYPYPANFLQDLPANPVQKFCKYLEHTDISSDKSLLRDLFQAINIYINNTGKTQCFDYSDQSMFSSSYTEKDDTALDYQSCTELIDPDCDDGINDFFEPSKWNFDTFSETCHENYRIRPKPELLDLFFGGRNIIAASNIVFSNGLLDPWYGYGVLSNLSDTLLAVVMPDAAHHLDLRGANPADPPSVIDAREFEKRQIRKWISGFSEDQKKIEEAFANNF